ncbi:uncharacterized protein FTJAE_13072 [Fusarium tjaetaba]|uniref:Uncharacterized protein n=1 Tax=Fusarium tjaetaba TaxID=1567544 RepID=A0A8H5VCF4_9HYPO|nr:uncharacterized protein FTJAE_13072 [Fusarium tjaetaba]KAF5616129.1 hypothetical protein FTJAE_13072 [Fusarium tjaetaba]
MSSPSKEEAGLNTPPKSNGLENTVPNIEAPFETDQNVEAPKLPNQEKEVPKPWTGSDIEDPDKELELLIIETVRTVRALWSEGEQEHFIKLDRARARERQEMEKHTRHHKKTKTQEPTVGTQEDVEEGKQTDDAVSPGTDDILDLASAVAETRIVR